MEKIGMDLGMKQSEICELDEKGNVLARASISTTRTAIKRWFGKRSKAEICLEAGGSSPWVDRLLRELGHDVVVVNPRRVKLIAESTLKTDRVDAETRTARAFRGEGRFLPISPDRMARWGSPSSPGLGLAIRPAHCQSS